MEKGRAEVRDPEEKTAEIGGKAWSNEKRGASHHGKAIQHNTYSFDLSEPSNLCTSSTITPNPKNSKL